MTDDFRAADAVSGGRLVLEGAAAAVHRALDRRVRALALEDGAVECRFPCSIAGTVLERAGYFDAFADGAAEITGGNEAPYFLSPAVCYHAYARLAGTRLDAPVLLTAAGTCFRQADRGVEEPGRLWEFSMREIIFIGPPEWIASHRRTWTLRADALVRGWGLEGSILPAADPFFGGAGRGRRLMQQLKGLKDELRLCGADGASMAAASFNSHETFFGGRFGITLPGGADAHSGCAAFGLERWTLALLARHGDRSVEVVSDAGPMGVGGS